MKNTSEQPISDKTRNKRALRILICWDVINGYMATCWRTLAAQPGVDLEVVAVGRNMAATTLDYPAELCGDLKISLFQSQQLQQRTVLFDRVLANPPDLILIAGWSFAAYVALVMHPQLRDSYKIMTMDTNRRGGLRQLLAPLKIGRLLRRLDRVFVPGERAWQLARAWGLPIRKLSKGSLGFDACRLRPCLESRLSIGHWPKRFVFVGQYIDRKGIPELLDAYTLYRQRVPNPWPLVFRGQGPLRSSIEATSGVLEEGFIAPDELPTFLSQAGVFVHPSRYDAWGVAIAEAGAAGLPILATETCGASVELIRDGYNGILVPPNDIERLAWALNWLHDHHALLPVWGARSQVLADPYSAEEWVRRVLQMIAYTDA